MKENQNLFDTILSPKLLIFTWGIILFICVFLYGSIVGHCASDQDYFPMFQNNNNHFSEYDKTAIEDRFNAEDNYIFAYFSGYQAGYGTRMKVFHILVVPKNSGIIIYGEKFNNLYQFSIYGGGGTLANNMCYQYSILEQNWKYEYSDSLSSFQNLQSSNYNTDIDYVSNIQIMTNNTSTAQVVLFYDDGVTIPDGDTARDDMEKPDIDDYIPDWSNRPSFDGSSVENALNSIWDITVWTAENTRDTITGVGKFIGDTLRWISQKIIDSIRSKIDDLKTGIINAINGISAFIQDIKGLVTTISQKIDYISQPLNVSTIVSAFNSTDIGTDYGSLTGLVNNAFGVFTSTEEPETFVLTLHLENIPILNTPVQTIDLGLLNTVKGVLRACMWCLTTFGLLYTIIDSIPSYINGNDE